jgi:hypothetical protein
MFQNVNIVSWKPDLDSSLRLAIILVGIKSSASTNFLADSLGSTSFPSPPSTIHPSTSFPALAVHDATPQQADFPAAKLPEQNLGGGNTQQFYR